MPPFFVCAGNGKDYHGNAPGTPDTLTIAMAKLRKGPSGPMPGERALKQAIVRRPKSGAGAVGHTGKALVRINYSAQAGGLEPTSHESGRPTLGGALRALRVESEQSLPQLGEAADLTAGYLSRVENDLQLPAEPFMERIVEALTTDEAERGRLMSLRRVAELERRSGISRPVAELAVALDEGRVPRVELIEVLRALPAPKRRSLKSALVQAMGRRG